MIILLLAESDRRFMNYRELIHLKKCRLLPSLTVVYLSRSGPPTHPHVVKTASIGTLGRTRTPMIVTVPNAPDVPETSKMLEDVDSVSIAPHSGCL